MKAEGGKKDKWIQGGMSLLLLLFLISSAVVITLYFRPLYYWDMDGLDIPARAGMERQTVKENYDVLVDYNLLWHRGELELPDFSMSEEGRIHFREVKGIFDFFQIAWLISLAGLAIYWLCRRHFCGAAYVRWAGFGALGITGALSLLALIGWERVFVLFHQVFFRNDFWIFDASTDPVITILPDTFFLHGALLMVGLVLLGGILCLLLGRRKVNLLK